MSRKQAILEALEILRNKKEQENEIFKARAYDKVLAQIRVLPKVDSMNDLKEVHGIGKSIRAKLKEIFETGELKMVEELKLKRKEVGAPTLMKIHGIGPVKLKELNQLGIYSIPDLEQALHANPSILNEQQLLGLKYMDELKLKIPRSEMNQHHSLLELEIKKASDQFTFELVGSYRRGVKESGDIDVLLTLPLELPERSTLFRNLCHSLKKIRYIQAMLALGNKKCMAICKIHPTAAARRIDLVLTTPEEYPFAILHGTGSNQFEIAIRKHAMKRGYSMNEYGMKKMNIQAENVPKMTKEKDIFNFLKYPYVEPQLR